jgi:hypothetical protein
VRYDTVNAMLLNEFVRDHRKIEQQSCGILEQEAMITPLRTDMESLIAHTKKQDLQVQRVSAQVNVSTPGSAIVASGP